MTEAGRLSPEHHMWLLCRCGEPVHLPAFAVSFVVCKCRRRFSYDCDTIRVVRPPDEREAA